MPLFGLYARNRFFRGGFRRGFSPLAFERRRRFGFVGRGRRFY